MVNTQAVSDAELVRLRDTGELICHCSWTVPQHIDLFNAWQCPRCFKALPRHTHQQGSDQ
jgi:hypothetical protein